MNALTKKEKKEKLEQYKKDMLLKIFESKEDLYKWIQLFVGWKLTKGWIDKDSNSSPIDAIWEVYNAVKNNTGAEIPGYILLSSRDSYKTLSVSVLEVLLMLHFRCTVAHMAAIKSQSSKAISYINGLVRKLKPYLSHHGWELASDNKTKIQFDTPEGDSPYITVIIASLTGANSEHTNILCVDGKTTMLTKNTRPSCPNRVRMSKTARGVYRDFIKGDVLETVSYNHCSGEIEFKPITKAFVSKQPQWEILLESGKILRVGHDHECFVFGKGYLMAKDIAEGDFLVELHKTRMGSKHKFRNKKTIKRDFEEANPNTFEQVLYGSLLGDGGVYKKETNNAHYSSTHGISQKDYLMWKKDILGQELDMHDYFVEKNGCSQKPAHRIYSGNTKTLNKIVSFRKNFDGIEKLDALGLAVWFMDDGSSSDSSNFVLHTEGFSYEQHLFLKDFLSKKFDINVSISGYVGSETGTYYNILRGDSEAFWRLYDICGKYIHPTMMYKINGLLRSATFTCRYCGETLRRIEDGGTYCFCCTKRECQSVHKRIVHKSKVVKSFDTGKTKTMYDFTVKDNHNFFGNGVLLSNCVDELDVIPNPKAYDEAKMIPGVQNGRFPITIKLSTRKFAFGLMNSEIENRHISGEKLLRWNIMDTSERCPSSKCRPDLAKKRLFVQTSLPLNTISEEEFSSLEETKKTDFEMIEAFSGCEKCKLLPVCRTKLADRDNDCSGGFYKPIDAVLNLFRVNNPDIADAQLLCNKPSTKGLVYPRFDHEENTLSTEDAYFELTGEKRKNVTFAVLVELIKSLDLLTYCGVDWGYRHLSAFVVGCRIPNGDFWIIDTYAQEGMELDDLVRVGLDLQGKYNIKKFFCDQAYPAYIATFKRKGMSCPKFTKDVMGGVQLVRGQICDSVGRRRFKVLKTSNNEMLLSGFKAHHFTLNAQGQLTQNVDDEEWSDIMDALRYLGQNLFNTKGSGPAISQDPAPVTFDPNKQVPHQVVHNHQMKEELRKMLGDNDVQVTENTDKKRGRLFWSM